MSPPGRSARTAQNLLSLTVGVVVGVVLTVGFQHSQRVQARQRLPLLAERKTSPSIDELPYVVLSRQNGNLDLNLYGGMGNKHKNFKSLLEEDRAFGIEDPIVRIEFEPGVTIGDLEQTLRDMRRIGVRRFFLGSSFYGKIVTDD
jgi:hypothetical protein